MGVEVAGSELPKVNGEIIVVEEWPTESITFGSHGVTEQPANGEVKKESNGILPNPKDAVDEWPAELQVHSFWLTKYRPYEDPKLKAEMDVLDKDIQKKSAIINNLYDELNAKRDEKEVLHTALNSLKEEKSQYQEFMDQKREEMKPLQSALGDLRGPSREKGVAICSSEGELNRLIRSLEYRIQHESVPLKEEKQILREMKELEATRPRVIAADAQRQKVQESMGQKESIQDRVKLLGTDLDGVRKQKAVVVAKRDQLVEQLNVIKDQIKKLKEEIEALKNKKNASIDSIKKLRIKRDAGNEDFNQNRNLLRQAKEIAAKKDVKALAELVDIEVEKFMSEWNSNKSFRNSYEKRILPSLDMRQLSRDGRMRNFDERPLVKVESPVPSETTVASRATSKPQKEESKTSSKAENLPAEQPHIESKKGSKESKALPVREVEEDIFVVEKKEVLKDKEIDASKLKEMKKEEEKEKQRQALERKKKLQEKAVAKAALKAQKEAEKKQKALVKKMKKKEASSGQPNEEEPTENAEADEPEKSDNADELVETLAPSKTKDQKENALRRRKIVKPRGTLPKAILKKKRSPNYWLWGSAAAAAVVVLILFTLGYNYLQKTQVVG